MNHAVGPSPNDQYAQPEALQALLVSQASIHRQQDVKPPVGTSQKLAIIDPGPAGGLHRRNVVSRQFSDKITGQVLVKQNAHRLGGTSREGLLVSLLVMVR